MQRFLFLETPWNVFLAVLPVVFGWLLARGVRRYPQVPWVAWLPLALVWFLFLPNTCYLLTEWRHFLWDRRLPVWYDVHEQGSPDRLELCLWALFFLIYSSLGAVTFVLATRPIKAMLQEHRVALWPVAIPFYLLNSFGVFLGFIIQLNSWDVWTRGGYVLSTAWQALQPAKVQLSVALFAVVLWGIYECTDIWLDGLKLRMQPGQQARQAT